MDQYTGDEWAHGGADAPVRDKKFWAAFLLLLLFGVLGAHRFYLRRVGSARGQLGITVVLVLIWLLSLVFIGALGSLVLLAIPVIATGALVLVVWLVIYLFLIPGMVRKANVSG